MLPGSAGNYVLLGGLICAAIGAASDVRSQRIPNWLTYGGAATGLVMQAIAGGWRGFLSGAGGLLIGGGVFFLFFVVRGMGAGDVKLMAAVGAWVGWQHIVLVMVITAVAGGALAVAYMVFYRRVGSTVQNMGELLRFHLTSGVKPHPEVNLNDPAAVRVPYGLAIAAGTLFVFLSAATFWRG